MKIRVRCMTHNCKVMFLESTVGGRQEGNRVRDLYEEVTDEVLVDEGNLYCLQEGSEHKFEFIVETKERVVVYAPPLV